MRENILWTWLKFAGFLRILWKKHLWSKKGSQNNMFENFFNFWYFLSLEALSNSSKVQISQKRKIIPRKVQKRFLTFFLTTELWRAFLELLIFYLILSTFTSFSALQLHWSVQNQEFSNFSKNCFFAFFWTSPLWLGCFFDKINHPFFSQLYRPLSHEYTHVLFLWHMVYFFMSRRPTYYTY